MHSERYHKHGPCLRLSKTSLTSSLFLRGVAAGAASLRSLFCHTPQGSIRLQMGLYSPEKVYTLFANGADETISVPSCGFT